MVKRLYCLKTKPQKNTPIVKEEISTPDGSTPQGVPHFHPNPKPVLKETPPTVEAKPIYRRSRSR